MVFKKKKLELTRQEDLPPVTSIASECNELKKEYDACFINWYPKFLKGNRDMSECDALLQSYTSCVKEALKIRKISIDDNDCPKFLKIKKHLDEHMAKYEEEHKRNVAEEKRKHHENKTK